ncbi:hypothetical protein [Robertmurraya sp. Marseille-Q9965]
MKKIQYILIILVIMLVLTGCWDRTEVNDLAFVTATGIDKLEDNLFQVSIQVLSLVQWVVLVEAVEEQAVIRLTM